MPDTEYDDYIPEHPEFIPGNRTQAESWVAAAVAVGIQQCDTPTFLKAWWAFAWLNPGFHPEDYRQWDELHHAQELAIEAFRRNRSGEIHDDELYAAEATHNAVWLELCRDQETPIDDDNQRIVTRTNEGQKNAPDG